MKRSLQTFLRGAGVVSLLYLGIAGCAHTSNPRSQAPDEIDRDSDVKIIGDVTAVSNAEAISVSGVGLVSNLEGTGGSAPSGLYRDMLEKQLRREHVQNIKELLADPNYSMVMVSARLPAGIRK